MFLLLIPSNRDQFRKEKYELNVESFEYLILFKFVLSTVSRRVLTQNKWTYNHYK